MNKCEITVIIPVFNECRHVRRAILSVFDYVDQVLIVDSGSTDNTLDIVKNISKTIDIICIPCISFSDKMNRAKNSDLIRNKWVMRLDADEIVVGPNIFFEKLTKMCNKDYYGVDGIYVIRRYYFLAEWVKFGGMYPRYVMRVFLKDKAVYEARLLDEKVLLEGKSEICSIEIADISKLTVSKWFRKHLAYAKKEATIFKQKKQGEIVYDLEFDNKTAINKGKYYSFPPFLRPLLYYLYRLFILFGFRDGMKGQLYHFLHSIVYRELVDLFIVLDKYKLKLNTTK